MGATTSTSGIHISTSGWSTNDRTSILVTNEDVGVVTSFRSDNGCYSKEDRWESCYDQ